MKQDIKIRAENDKVRKDSSVALVDREAGVMFVDMFVA